MSEFTPKTWQDGDAITDVELNRLENRVGELNVNNVFDIKALPTWNQVKNLLEQDIIPVITDGNTQDYIISIQKVNSGHIIYFCNTLFSSNFQIADTSDPNVALQVVRLVIDGFKE